MFGARNLTVAAYAKKEDVTALTCELRIDSGFQNVVDCEMIRPACSTASFTGATGEVPHFATPASKAIRPLVSRDFPDDHFAHSLTLAGFARARQS